MADYNIISLRGRPEYCGRAARWFHEKWDVPESEYISSMNCCIAGGGAVPQRYIALDGEKITGGVGVIENDFHERRDLAPNVCALYVEPEHRGHGLARALLEHVCRDMADLGVVTLYLITDHEELYERLGWDFVTMVNCTDGSAPARLYRRTSQMEVE